MFSQILVANEVFAVDKVGNIEDDDKLIKKYRKLSKIRKLSKSQKSAKLEKNCQKVRIHLISTLKKTGRAFLPLTLKQLLTAYG